MCISPNMMYQTINHTGDKKLDSQWHFAPFDLQRFKEFQHSHLYKCVLIPCGHCKECRKSYASQWAYRLMKESELYQYKYFITLTYSDVYVPLTKDGINTLRREDLKRFIHSLQANLRKTNMDLKYSFFACGEYGEHGFRPHYHLVFLSNTEIPLQKYHVVKNGDQIEYVPVVSCNKHELTSSFLLESIWQKGLISIGEVTCESCAYTTGYTAKKYNDDFDFSMLGVELPFVSMTKGIGKNYFNEKSRFLLDNDCDFMISKGHAKRVVLPRYFDRLTEKMYQEKYDDIKAERYKRSKSDYLTLAFKHKKDIKYLYKTKKLASERSNFVRK